MEAILGLDEQLFKIINGGWHVDWLDYVMPYWRDKKFWYPLYLGLLGFLIYRFRIKGIYFILFLIANIGLADTVSSKLFKPNIQRVRPCNDPALAEDVVLLVGCGRAYSFTSSHAANHFAIAGFFVVALGWYFRRWK